MKQEILTRINIHNYIGRFINLNQKGRDQYLGLCPFHHEKTPSFSVAVEKKFFHCFGCKVSGDVVKFVMLYDNLEYDKAIEKLATEAGIKTVRKGAQLNPNKLYIEINSKFANICHSLLKDTNYHYGIDYLRSRQLKDEMIDRFQLGYLPINKSEEVFKNLLREFSQEDLFKSGLFKLGIRDKPYCQFNGRIIFPIIDTNKNIVGFGSRVLTEEGKPKYINSSDSDFFHKSELLYGLNKIYGDKMLKDTKTVFVVEGYMDVILLANYEITNCVAVLGANLTTEQLKKLWTFIDRPTICFDNDSAGRAAMERIAKLALKVIEPGKSISFLELSSCKDPDEFVKKNGPDHFLQHFNNKRISLADYLYKSESNELSLQDPDEVVVLRQRLSKITDEIANDMLRNEYKRHFNKLFYSFKDDFRKNSAPRHDIIKLKLSQKVGNDEERLCNIISKHQYLLMDQEMLDDFINCKFKSDVAENMRLQLTKKIDKGYVEERNEEIVKQVKSLIIFLKIRDVQDEILRILRIYEDNMDINIETQIIELKKYEIQLQNKLSLTI